MVLKIHKSFKIGLVNINIQYTPRVYTVDNMRTIFRKKETEEESNIEKEPLLVLQELEKEEKSLIRKKENLLALKKSFENKTLEEIEIKKRSIQALKNEVAELEHECKVLQNLVKKNIS